jgi:hypothetical protein
MFVRLYLYPPSHDLTDCVCPAAADRRSDRIISPHFPGSDEAASAFLMLSSVILAVISAPWTFEAGKEKKNGEKTRIILYPRRDMSPLPFFSLF